MKARPTPLRRPGRFALCDWPSAIGLARPPMVHGTVFVRGVSTSCTVSLSLPIAHSNRDSKPVCGRCAIARPSERACITPDDF